MTIRYQFPIGKVHGRGNPHLWCISSKQKECPYNDSLLRDERNIFMRRANAPFLLLHFLWCWLFIYCFYSAVKCTSLSHLKIITPIHSIECVVYMWWAKTAFIILYLLKEYIKISKYLFLVLRIKIIFRCGAFCRTESAEFSRLTFFTRGLRVSGCARTLRALGSMRKKLSIRQGRHHEVYYTYTGSNTLVC